MATVPNKADVAAVIDHSNDNNRFQITPSDIVPLRVPIQALYVMGAGDVAMKNGNGDTIVLTYAEGGPYYVGGITHILATGTSATGIYGLASKGLR